MISPGDRRSVRPGDGSTPPPVYHWVVPPAGTTGTAATPATGGHTTVSMTPTGSAAAGFATEDGQVAVSLGPGAIAAVPGVRAVRLRITPLATKGLPRLPDGLRANGNAYRITATAVPGATSVGTFTRPGSVTIELPELGRALYRETGSGWVVVPATPVPPRELAVSAELTAPGVYVSGTDLPPAPPVTDATTTGSGNGTTLPLIVVGLALVLVAAIGAFVLARRRWTRPVSASAGSPGPGPASPDHPSGS